MAKRNPRPLTPQGKWVKAKSIQTEIELREIAKMIGILPQNLTAKMHGERPFSDGEFAQIEEIYNEKFSESRSA